MKCIKCGIELIDENSTYKASKPRGRKICDDCWKGERKQYYIKNREKILVHVNEYNDKHRKEKKDRGLKYIYGIGLDELKKMIEEQNYKCKICGKELKIIDGKKNKDLAVVDHNHMTGKIRGVLCHSCNTLLGFAHDNSEILKNAIEYLDNLR